VVTNSAGLKIPANNYKEKQMRTENYTAPGAGFTLTRYIFDSPKEEKQFHITQQEQLGEMVRTATEVCRTCGNRSASFCEMTRKLQSDPFHTCDNFETPGSQG